MSRTSRRVVAWPVALAVTETRRSPSRKVSSGAAKVNATEVRPAGMVTPAGRVSLADG